MFHANPVVDDAIVIISVERGADGVRVLNWYHRQFIEAARERYCQNEEKLAYLHSGLAEFFSGTWSGGMLELLIIIYYYL